MTAPGEVAAGAHPAAAVAPRPVRVAISEAQGLLCAEEVVAERPLPAFDQAIAQYEKLAQEQSQKKEELRRQAAADQQNYDALNYRDDQFDLSDAAIAVSIAVLAVAALTQLWWLYAVAMVPAGFGTLMGIAGLAGLKLHPGFLAQLLS